MHMFKYYCITYNSSICVVQTLNNHRGHLESCTISHIQFIFLFIDRWTQTVTREKQTKEITLVNNIGCMTPFVRYNSLHLSPSAFCHPSLTSLSLTRYKLLEKAFKNCCNLKILKLYDIMSDVSVLSNVIKACSSLEVLVLQITFLNQASALKIENKKLEFLQVTWPCLMNRMEVNTPRLVIFDIKSIYCFGYSVEAPKLSMFKRDYWVGGMSYPHLSYHISSLAQVQVQATCMPLDIILNIIFCFDMVCCIMNSGENKNLA